MEVVPSLDTPFEINSSFQCLPPAVADQKEICIKLVANTGWIGVQLPLEKGANYGGRGNTVADFSVEDFRSDIAGSDRQNATFRRVLACPASTKNHWADCPI